ncbi:MAG: MiaB/RimO family radical SAM methylthiotransferase, partial [Firmicutes bacterium]|nr:MiaB/RimO family radical SAM methylthiotransferase [Bacillota bacterium]
RGRERSRSADSILQEINSLIKNGYKQIVLLGQNVNSYKYENYDLAALLKSIAKIEGKFRVKFLTSHPKDLSKEVVEVVASSHNFSSSIHLPVQAGSDRVLKLMNRGYTRAEYLKKIEMIKNTIPDVGLSTDIISGFPSETEDEFDDTLALINQIKFDNIFAFIYNRRSGTAADLMEGQLDKQTKVDRNEKLKKLQKQIASEIASECRGKVFEVLCESQEGTRCMGQANSGKIVVFFSQKNVYGQFVDVIITGAKGGGLIGEIVQK